MNPERKESDLQLACHLLRSARHAIVLTGAGISTSSGIPDFRSQGSGLWTKNDPMQVASLSAYRFRPDRFYNWLRPLAGFIQNAKPNTAHTALAQLEQAGVIKAIITQNIDGLHQRAGSQRVLEVHGSLTYLVCPFCQSRYHSSSYWDAFVAGGEIPRCPRDQGNLKPDIVLFEEMLPAGVWQESEAEALQADLVFVIGSSLEVSPANLLPGYAVEKGAGLIINTRSTTFMDDYAAVLLPDDIAEVIPEIARRVLA